MTPFRRDGHLSDLGIDHLLDGSPLPGTDEHLTGCLACAARVQAADDVPMPAMPAMPAAVTAPAASVPVPANRPWMWGPLATAAVAAVALIAVPRLMDSPAAGDGIRVKGARIGLELFRDGGSVSARLRNGDAVAPGDRLGFQVRHPEGHLMIVGIDSRDDPYLCYPQGAEGQAAAVGASRSLHTLPEAVEFDDTPGTERIVAVHCEQPFTFDTMADALLDGDLPEGCSSTRVELEKP